MLTHVGEANWSPILFGSKSNDPSQVVTRVRAATEPVRGCDARQDVLSLNSFIMTFENSRCRVRMVVEFIGV